MTCVMSQSVPGIDRVTPMSRVSGMLKTEKP